VPTPEVSDEAVKKATGKAWRRWFSLLDRVGASAMSHREKTAVHFHHEELSGVAERRRMRQRWSKVLDHTAERLA
jgi:hypothetical protein